MQPQISYLRQLGLAALLASSSSAQSIFDSLSFGHSTPLSSNGQQINHWHVGFEGPPPPVLSDRIILTPPAPGNIRSGLWSDGALPGDSFHLDFGFRASGPERGSGNLQLWFVKDPLPASSLSSVYTVNRFEGLAIAIDQYSGAGGSVRGFLNDGSVDYHNHHNLDSLAFGHCSYSYRNLGRWSNLKVKQDAAGFEVLIDDKTCFKSNIISFPSGYRFGISAASADTPDSFEVNKFVVSSASQAPSTNQGRAAAPPVAGGAQNQAPISGGRMGSGDQADLVERMQSLSQTLRSTYDELAALGSLSLQRHNELKTSIGSIPAIPQAQIQAMDRRIQNVEATVQRIQRDIEGRDYKDTLTGLQKALKDTQNDLMSNLPQSMSQIVTTSAPKMWFFIAVIIAFQGLLALGYVLYKRRLNNSPKKLL